MIFESDGIWVAHRLIKIDNTKKKLITKGDGLSHPDKPVQPEMVKGVITKIIKSRSPLAWTVNTKFDKLMVFAGPVLGKIFRFTGLLTGKAIRSFKSSAEKN